MSIREEWGFDKPEDGMSLQAALEFIYNGFDYNQEDFAHDAAWLEYCSRAFHSEKYFETVMMECGRLVHEMLPEYYHRRFSWLPEDEMDLLPMSELADMAYYALADGDVAAADFPSFKAARKADWFADDWTRAPYPVYCFSNPIEKSVFIAEYGTDDKYEWRWPDISYVYRMRGEALTSMERYGEAIRYLMLSCRYNPVSAPAYISIAECSAELGHSGKVYEQASIARECAWSVYDIARAHYLMGYACDLEGRLKEAEAHLVLALDYFPDPDAKAELSYVRSQMQEDTPHLSLEDALYMVGDEDDGQPVDSNIRAALVQLALSLKGTGNYYLGMLERERPLWDRDKRKAFYASMTAEERRQWNRLV